MDPINNAGSRDGASRTAIDGTQVRVALLCGIVAMMDGFDTQAVAFVAPVLGVLWKVGPDLLGLKPGGASERPVSMM